MSATDANYYEKLVMKESNHRGLSMGQISGEV
jgi:hypothetical protein